MNKARYIILFATVLVLILVGFIIWQSKRSITGQFADKTGTYSFTVPEGLEVSEVGCIDDENCVTMFTVREKERINDLFTDATIKIVKDCTKVELGGQTMSTKFEDGHWIYGVSTDEGRLTTELVPESIFPESEKKVITTTSQASRAAYTYYIYQSDTSTYAVVVSIPESTRVVCDNEPFERGIINCEGKLEELEIPLDSDTWISRPLYENLKTETLKLLESFTWED